MPTYTAPTITDLDSFDSADVRDGFTDLQTVLEALDDDNTSADLLEASKLAPDALTLVETEPALGAENVYPIIFNATAPYILGSKYGNLVPVSIGFYVPEDNTPVLVRLSWQITKAKIDWLQVAPETLIWKLDADLYVDDTVDSFSMGSYYDTVLGPGSGDENQGWCFNLGTVQVLNKGHHTAHMLVASSSTTTNATPDLIAQAVGRGKSVVVLGVRA